jgi:cephalosporin-C deacetylase-like acetyl esterase/lysophospholipase L1-like esterase
MPNGRAIASSPRILQSMIVSLFTVIVGSQCIAQRFVIKPFNPIGIYALNEKAGWTISLPKDAPATSAKYTYTLKKNNFDIIQSGVLDLSAGPATVSASIDEPAMLYLQIALPLSLSESEVAQPKEISAGAAIAPTKLQPGAPRPADFDDFWDSKIKLLEAIPPNPVITPSKSDKPNVEFDIIRMDHVDGHHIYGQLAKPNRPGKFPAVAIFQWASPPYPLEKNWVTDRAAEGWLALNIEPHDVLPDRPKSYYKALPESLKRYQTIGEDDRDKSYFVRMYLADYRAVEYLASRPDWDGKTLVVMGTSMGGQQSLCVAGLNPKVTHLIVNEPAGCDTNGPLHGRQSGYPNFPADNPKIMQTAQYVDPINFASRITATSLVAMGFVDTTAPPVGVWTAFNQIKGPKEAVPMIDSPHNNLATAAQQRPYTSQSSKWLGILAKGGSPDVEPLYTSPVEKSGASVPADQASPRTDVNSQRAHLQLLEKAKQGGIDIYFEGDSITRRWGASDAQYKELLDNWTANFHGWNAADFGWGGDTTQNILWRLKNGELDNVNPKIIVIQCGTNNIGPNAADGVKIGEITRGIKAVVDLCQAKAPSATLLITGIFPRNDNMAAMPAINQIDENLRQLANGKTIRYININAALADENGRLHDGMMNSDALHPTVKAYQVWADAIKPIFTELLGPPATSDHAPAPTGDPSAMALK